MSTKTWTAECFMGSDVGWQEVTVQSNTVHGARKMIERIYEPEFIQNLREDGSFEGCNGIGLGCLSVFWLPLLGGFVVSLFFGTPFFVGLSIGTFLYFLIK